MPALQKMTQKNIIVDGLNINYYQSEESDKQETRVFLHGWGSEALHLKSIFENRADFIAVDLPGFGKSDLPSKAWSVSDYAVFLSDFLNKLQLVNPVLIGHSIGGAIAMKYASVKPAEKLIIIAGAGIRKKSFKIYFYWLLAKIFKIIFALPGLNLIYDKIRVKFYKLIGSEDYMNAGEMAETYKKIIREDLSEDMKKITTKTFLIWGENDRETPLKNARKINALIKNSELFIIKNAGHFPFLDQKDEFNKIFQKNLEC